MIKTEEYFCIVRKGYKRRISFRIPMTLHGPKTSNGHEFLFGTTYSHAILYMSNILGHVRDFYCCGPALMAELSTVLPPIAYCFPALITDWSKALPPTAHSLATEACPDGRVVYVQFLNTEACPGEWSKALPLTAQCLSSVGPNLIAEWSNPILSIDIL